MFNWLKKFLRDRGFSVSKYDKTLHLFVSAFLYIIGYHTLPWASWWIIFLVLGIGFGKELFDKSTRGHFDWYDILWDGIGVGVGILFSGFRG